MATNDEKPWTGAPADPASFFVWLKRASEAFWETVKLDGRIYGFQIQQGTKWNPGLTTQEIVEYEHNIGFKFPEVFKQYLRVMNGTDKKTINIYGNSGEPHAFGTGFYSYPRDMEEIKSMIAWIYEENDVSEPEVVAERIPHIMPIVSHRFLVIDNCDSNPILSMYGNDIILYATSLQHFLTSDVFNSHGVAVEHDDEVRVDFWL